MLKSQSQCRERSDPEWAISAGEQKGKEGQRLTAKLQKAELTSWKSQSELQMEQNSELLMKLMSHKSCLELYRERDTSGREYLIDQPGCQGGCCPIILPPSCFLCLQAGQLKKSMISMATARTSVSSDILFIPT